MTTHRNLSVMPIQDETSSKTNGSVVPVSNLFPRLLSPPSYSIYLIILLYSTLFFSMLGEEPRLILAMTCFSFSSRFLKGTPPSTGTMEKVETKPSS